MYRRWICVSLAMLISFVCFMPFAAADNSEESTSISELMSIDYEMLNLAHAVAVIENGAVSHKFIGGMAELSGGSPTSDGSILFGRKAQISYDLREGTMIEGIPADETTLFRIGRVSRIFIWIAIMQLYERGIIDLDTDITEYLGKYSNLIRTIDGNDVTITHLMNGTVGWEDCYRYQAYYDNIADDSGYEVNGADNLYKYISSIRPVQHFSAGALRTGSDFEAIIASLIVEQMSGQSYVDYVTENILQPLDMLNTSLDSGMVDRKDLRSHIAASFVNYNYDYLASAPSLLYATIPALNGACSTLDDMCKLMIALTSDYTLLFDNESSQELLFSASYSVGEDLPVVSHGIEVLDGAELTIGFTVDDDFSHGEFAFCPSTGKGLIVLTNHNTSYSDPLSSSLHAVLFGSSSIVVDDSQLPKTASLAGEYVRAGGLYYGYMDLANRFNMTSMLVIKPYNDTSTKKLFSHSEYQSLNQAYTVRLTFSELTQIAPYTFLDKNGSVVRFLVNDDGSVNRIFYNGTEYVQMPWHRSIAITNVTVIFYYIMALFCVLAFFVIVVSIFRNRKNCMHNMGSSHFVIPLYLALTAAVVNCSILLFSSAGSLSYAACTIHFIVNYICTALMLVFITFMLIKWNRSELFQHQKVGYIMLICMSLAMIVLMVFWNLYR